jgi:WD40 repeat protein
MKAPPRSYTLASLHSTQPRVARSITPQEVVLLDWEKQSSLGRFRSQAGTVMTLALSPCGSLVALAGEEGRVEIWQAEQAQRLASLDLMANGLRFCEQGQHLLVASPGLLSCWDWQSGQRLWEHRQELFQNPALLDVQGEHVLWSAMAAPDLELLDSKSGQVVQRWSTRDEFMAVAFHPDGKRIAANVNTVRSPLLHQFVMLRIGNELPDREFPIPFMSVSVAVSPGGGTIATGDGRGVQLWDFASGSPEGRLAPRTETKVKDFGTVEVASAFLVSTLRFTNDGKGLVSDGDSFCHWDVTSKNPHWSYP